MEPGTRVKHKAAWLKEIGYASDHELFLLRGTVESSRICDGRPLVRVRWDGHETTEAIFAEYLQSAGKPEQIR